MHKKRVTAVGGGFRQSSHSPNHDIKILEFGKQNITSANQGRKQEKQFMLTATGNNPFSQSRDQMIPLNKPGAQRDGAAATMYGKINLKPSIQAAPAQTVDNKQK